MQTTRFISPLLLTLTKTAGCQDTRQAGSRPSSAAPSAEPATSAAAEEQVVIACFLHQA